MKGFSADSQSAYEKAGTVSTEAVGGIRTVASFTNEEKLLKMYSERLEEPARLGVKKAHVSGIGFGASQFCMFAINTLAFWYGGRLVDQREWGLSEAYIIEQCSSRKYYITLLRIRTNSRLQLPRHFPLSNVRISYMA